MKKIIKLISLILLLLSSFVIIEMISISTKYINKPTISFGINNIRNPQIKKFTRNIDNLYASILIKFSKEHREYFDQKERKFEELPEYKSISAKIDNFTISDFRENNNLYDWKRSHGNHSSNRFSDLKKINLSNIKNLDLAWIYKFKEINRDIQSNPVIADGKIFIPTTGNSIVSIDAVNGRKIW